MCVCARAHVCVCMRMRVLPEPFVVARMHMPGEQVTKHHMGTHHPSPCLQYKEANSETWMTAELYQQRYMRDVVIARAKVDADAVSGVTDHLARGLHDASAVSLCCCPLDA